VSKENLEIVRQLMEAWHRGDMEAVFSLFDPAIVWDNSTVTGPNAGTYRDRENVRQFFREWSEAFETQQIQAETFIDARERVVVGYRLSGRGKASGAEVEMVRWLVNRVRNGLVTRIDVFETKAQALEAAGLQE
jgi:ketosteroid isomerase-like protein